MQHSPEVVILFNTAEVTETLFYILYLISASIEYLALVILHYKKNSAPRKEYMKNKDGTIHFQLHFFDELAWVQIRFIRGNIASFGKCLIEMK
jgi:hypothetical protein